MRKICEKNVSVFESVYHPKECQLNGSQNTLKRFCIINSIIFPANFWTFSRQNYKTSIQTYRYTLENLFLSYFHKWSITDWRSLPVRDIGKLKHACGLVQFLPNKKLPFFIKDYLITVDLRQNTYVMENGPFSSGSIHTILFLKL